MTSSSKKVTRKPTKKKISTPVVTDDVVVLDENGNDVAAVEAPVAPAVYDIKTSDEAVEAVRMANWAAVGEIMRAEKLVLSKRLNPVNNITDLYCGREVVYQLCTALFPSCSIVTTSGGCEIEFPAGHPFGIILALCVPGSIAQSSSRNDEEAHKTASTLKSFKSAVVKLGLQQAVKDVEDNILRQLGGAPSREPVINFSCTKLGGDSILTVMCAYDETVNAFFGLSTLMLECCYAIRKITLAVRELGKHITLKSLEEEATKLMELEGRADTLSMVTGILRAASDAKLPINTMARAACPSAQFVKDANNNYLIDPHNYNSSAIVPVINRIKNMIEMFNTIGIDINHPVEGDAKAAELFMQFVKASTMEKYNPDNIGLPEFYGKVYVDKEVAIDPSDEELAAIKLSEIELKAYIAAPPPEIVTDAHMVTGEDGEERPETATERAFREILEARRRN